MENKKNKINKELDEFEDSTKYGEFISSFFTWNTLEGQKERARKLENLTKDKRGKRDKWGRGLNVRKKSIFPVLHRFTRMKKTTNGNGENRSFRTFNPRPHLLFGHLIPVPICSISPSAWVDLHQSLEK